MIQGKHLAEPLPAGACTSIRFRSRMVRGDGCSPPLSCEAVSPQGQACSRTSPVIERGPFPEPGLVGLLANGPRGEHEKRRLQRTAFAKKQPPVIGSLPLYFYVNIYGYLIMQPSPPLLHLLRQGQACTQALSP